MTKIWGASDDLVEFDGDVYGEFGCFGTDDKNKGVLVACSDGTMLEVKYGKGGKGVWAITVLEKGALFERLDICTSEEADPYSDVAHFRDGLKYAYAARAESWEQVN